MMKKLVQYKKNKKGFTLVELIVVIAIIAILAAILLPKYVGFTDNARKSAAIADAKNIRTLAETYYASNGKWPVVIDSGTDTGFKVQTENKKDTDTDTVTATADNSPTFPGTITKNTDGTAIAAGSEITDGAFKYTSPKGYTAIFDSDGTITGTATE